MATKKDNNDLYALVKMIKKILIISFYINLGIVLLNLFLKSNNDVIIGFQIVFSLITIIGNFINDYFIFPQAEQRNLERNMENSFNIPFGDDFIDGYYDNSVTPSIKKFIANSFENIFYTKKILMYSFSQVWLRLLIFIIVFIVSITIIIYMKLDNGLKFFSSLIQILFSGQYILGAVKSIFYKYEIDKLYKNFYKEYKNSDTREYALLGYAIEYEVLKSSLKTMLDSKAFENNKDNIEREWNEEKKTIFKHEE